MVSPICFEIAAQTHARLPYSFLTQIFLQLGALEKEYTKLGFEKNCEDCESIFLNCCWDSSMSSILFSKLNFSSVNDTEKECMKQDVRKNFVDKVVEN